MNDIASRLAFAKETARKAGLFVMEEGRKGTFQVHDKQKNDFVTDVDTATERLIISRIHERFPEDGILGEETGISEGHASGGRWVIDPIDGTTNFVRSIPDYTISIAWEEEVRQPAVGVVYNPRQDELFWAASGQGAFCNDVPLHVSAIADPSRAILTCVPPHRRHALADRYFALERILFDQVSDIRSFGSCALELCYIAAGRLDGYFELCLSYYDLAAGALILQEAGGTVAGADPLRPFTDTRCDLLASNGLIQAWLSHTVRL